jgi:F-type H+-transporting ATPase subunit b
MRYRVGLAITTVLLMLLLSSCDAAQELGMNWHGLLGQFISFGVLLGLLFLFGYKPITRMLDERSQRIQEGMEQAESIKEQTATTEKLVHEQLAEARKQGQDVVAQAEQIGERLREEAREQAKQDAEAIVARARSEIQAEHEEAISGLRREFVDVAIQAAEKVINKSLDKEAHRQLIEDTLKESTGFKKEG